MTLDGMLHANTKFREGKSVVDRGFPDREHVCLPAVPAVQRHPGLTIQAGHVELNALTWGFLPGVVRYQLSMIRIWRFGAATIDKCLPRL